MPASATLAVPPAPLPIRCVSTDGVKLSDRREFWETSTSSVCGSHEVELLGGEPFRAELEHAEVSDLILARIDTKTAHRVIRTDPMARREDRHFVKAVLLTGGSCLLEQNGREAYLRAGEWSIYDNAQPYTMTIPGRAQMFIMLIPRDRFVARNVGLQNLVVRRLSGRTGIGKLIWNLVSNTFDQIPQILGAASHDVAGIVIQMTRLALGDSSGDISSVDSKSVLRDRIKLYIAGHLADPDLSLAKLASVTGCTKRYLHMAFEAENVSISDYILRQRLDRCRQDLLNPACAQRSITDIAYSWGFNNSNHFSRCFKQSFGASPRRLRSESAPRLAGSEVERKSRRILA